MWQEVWKCFPSPSRLFKLKVKRKKKKKRKSPENLDGSCIGRSIASLLRGPLWEVMWLPFQTAPWAKLQCMFIGADHPARPGTVKTNHPLYWHICLSNVPPIHKMCSGGIFTLWMRDSRILTSCRNSHSVASNEHLFVFSTKLGYERCSQPARKKTVKFPHKFSTFCHFSN